MNWALQSPAAARWVSINFYLSSLNDTKDGAYRHPFVVLQVTEQEQQPNRQNM
jgi:hypothetical protein